MQLYIDTANLGVWPPADEKGAVDRHSWNAHFRRVHGEGSLQCLPTRSSIMDDRTSGLTGE